MVVVSASQASQQRKKRPTVDHEAQLSRLVLTLTHTHTQTHTTHPSIHPSLPPSTPHLLQATPVEAEREAGERCVGSGEKMSKPRLTLGEKTVGHMK